MVDAPPRSQGLRASVDHLETKTTIKIVQRTEVRLRERARGTAVKREERVSRLARQERRDEGIGGRIHARREREWRVYNKGERGHSTKISW